MFTKSALKCAVWLLGLCVWTSAAADFELKLAIPDHSCALAPLQADGKIMLTAPLQAAIDACAAAGGGTLRFKAGTYLSGPLYLKSSVRLQLDEGATLLASTERELYRVTPDNNKYLVMQGWMAFLNAVDEHDIAISGAGIIDGQGAPWWSYYLEHDGKSNPTNRPRLVHFRRVKNALIEGVTLANSQSYNFVPDESENIEVSHVKIIAPADSPNTDGIDLSNSRNVFIHHCDIDTGDDNVAIKAGAIDPEHPEASSENITVADSIFRAGHGASIGSETNGGVRNVVFERIHFIGTDFAVRIKSYRNRGGQVSHITYRDLRLDNVRQAILLTAYYPKIPRTDPPQNYTVRSPWYHDIVLQNIRGTSIGPGGVYGLPEKPFTGIRFDNVHIETSAPLPVRNVALEAHDTSFGKGDAFAQQEQSTVDIKK